MILVNKNYFLLYVIMKSNTIILASGIIVLTALTIVMTSGKKTKKDKKVKTEKKEKVEIKGTGCRACAGH